ncbi:hypothetical protein, variant [Aphanomyces invadans]|nr:hypothetical protein, variant [Aphanomyces invadans]ETV95406.1 hypothetical protein, variant [Aphanomyces invadans]|eukprot:XP_008876107.1 hypothetical protein, variant [Aphanomyces invadans]
MGSCHAVCNTQLLKRYGELDPRVRPLVFAVKHWAKQRSLNDASNGTLSSYAWIMLVLFFLQARGILPCLSPLDEVSDTASTVASSDDMSTLSSPTNSTSSNHASTALSSSTQPITPSSEQQPRAHLGVLSAEKDSVGSLLVAFFQFYAYEFDYRHNVVSLRCGHALPKLAKWGLGLGTWRFSIEDPFDLHHDVGRVIFHPKGQERILNELRRAAEMSQVPTCQLDELCAAQVECTCFICDKPGHAPRDCADSTPTSTPVALAPLTDRPSPIRSRSTGGPPPPPPVLQALPPHAKLLKRPRRRSKSKGATSMAKKKLLVAWRTVA